ncbi:hypothetical protein HZA43_02390 [Candidatus Peregrinibacteria bacterium]|nr:hypothetical protein [Candidatus Peregrinibacteria bacterium]
MSVAQGNNLERSKAKPDVKESIGAILKKGEISQKPNVAQGVTEGVQGEVAEVLAGVEGPKEEASEKAGERGNERKPVGQSAGVGSQQAAMLQDLRNQSLPRPEVMITRIRMKIQADIQHELKNAHRLIGSLNHGSAHEYTTVIARIRKLQHLLRQLLVATVDFIKDLYLRLFTPSGKPREKSIQ